ncbi:NAD(P)/FAD-dependent oxidoreductase [Thermaurantiacus sp.]
MPDILIAGGGPAGAAAAVWLARGGRQVRLLEKERAPRHRICGEFLSWEAQAWLADCGVDLEALGAVPLTHLRLVAGARVVRAPLGFTGRSLTRLRLDAALLARAEAAGAEVVRGSFARSLEPDGTVLTSEGVERPAAFVVATGKQALRGASRPTAGTIDHQLGFKQYFRLRPAEAAGLAGHVELLLFDGGYAGLQPVEHGLANLCLLVSPARYAAEGGRFERLLDGLARELPHLARRLDGAVPQLARPLAIAGVPYGYRFTAKPGHPPHRFPVGDQATVIPSFTGDGMGLALHGARLAALTILARGTAEAYARRLARDTAGAVRRASLAQRLVGESPGRHARLLGFAARAPFLLTLGARLTRPRATAIAAAGIDRLG